MCNNIHDKAHIYICMNDKYTHKYIPQISVIVLPNECKMTMDGTRE